MKFKFDWIENRLWRIEDEFNYEIPEENQFTTNFFGCGFVLDSNHQNHWISFTPRWNSTRIFYKRVRKDGTIVYYQKDIPEQQIIECELTDDDEVVKTDGKWIKKVN